MADQDITDARDALEDLQIEYGHAQREARDLAVWLHKTYYADVVDWKPFNDASGLLTQIDNMVAGVRNRLAATEARELLLANTLRNLVGVIDAAGVRNLATGVQLGQVSWLVKANDALDAARSALSPLEASVSTPSQMGGIRVGNQDHWPMHEFMLRHMRDDSRWVDPSRTDEKSSHPYSYSEFFLYGDREVVKTATDALYSDRIWQWDREKASRCWSEHCKDRWDTTGSKQHSAFLSDFLGKPVRVIALAEGCNASNGYPYWIVWFVDVPQPIAKPSPPQQMSTKGRES